MFRFLFLLLILAGVAGYFTKPTEAQHREAARTVFTQAPGATEVLDRSEAQERAIAEGDLDALIEASIASLNGDADVNYTDAYEDYYVASRYTISLEGRAIADCWGAFAQVRCTPALADMAGAVEGL